MTRLMTVVTCRGCGTWTLIKIADENLNTLTTTGIRVYDISLRFKYSDIKVDRMTQDMADAITKCLETDSEVVYVLVNYTALYSTEAVLKKARR